MNTFRRLLFFALTLSFTTMACQKGCKKVEKKETSEKPERITTFDSLNFTDLSTAERHSLITFFNEEICPCGCPKTFAQCLLMKGCKAGQLLAQWTITKLKEGIPELYLFKAVSEEINAGFLAPQKTIDTKNAYRKGNPKAAMTIVEFADFECPACKIAALQLKEFLKENPNEVQLYFMHFPLAAHINAERAAIAAEAAGKQGKFWEMHDLLFGHTGPLTDTAIKELAAKLFTKKQLEQFEKDVLDPALLQKVREQKEYGQNELKLLGTPTFMLNGRPFNLYFTKDGYTLRLAMEKLRNEINCHSGN